MTRTQWFWRVGIVDVIVSTLFHREEMGGGDCHLMPCLLESIQQSGFKNRAARVVSLQWPAKSLNPLHVPRLDTNPVRPFYF